jgi:hypothetical protein
VRRIVIESPVRATDVYSQEQLYRYYQECARDAILNHDENPTGSHPLAQGILNDHNPFERALGIACGFDWGQFAEYVVVYNDLFISEGMAEAIKHWESLGKPVIRRSLGYGVIKMIQDMAD